MIKQLEEGLTNAQVQFIMGSPAIKNSFDSNRWDYIGMLSIGKMKPRVFIMFCTSRKAN